MKNNSIKIQITKLIKEELLKEGPQRQLEKYAETTWRMLSLVDKMKALQAIQASGVNQMMKKFGDYLFTDSEEYNG